MVIVDGKVITGSCYKIKQGNAINHTINYTKFEINEILHGQIFDFAKEAAKHFSPERAFVLDIAYINDDNQPYRVIEPNSFSCSGLYKCNMEKVVQHVSRAAIEDWNEIYGNCS